MTYRDLQDIEAVRGRLEAEKLAARYVAVQRAKLERLRTELDKRKDSNERN